MKDSSRMPEVCCGCRHFRNKRFVHKRLRLGSCAQVDDGYMNDCLLDKLDAASEEAKADEQEKMSKPS